MAVTIACSDDSNKIKTFSGLADITSSPSLTAAKEKYNMVLMYSVDGGQTFTDWPAVAKGQSYLATVVARDGGDLRVQPGSCFTVDWSGSVPSPDNVTGTTASFTMGHDNALLAKIADSNYGPFDRTFWLGDFTGTEHGACCEGGKDANTFRVDPTNPNAVIMNNFWGDGVDAQMVFTPSTNANDQVVTIPVQTTSEGGTITTASVGTYDECAQTISIPAIPYKIGTKTYTFGYTFKR